MLIRFTVENFLSFKNEVEFSMVPGRARMHRDHVYVDDRRKDIRLLKAGVIYGANASGKTNLIKAMDFAQNLIVDGTRANQSIASTPFLLDHNTEMQTSKFHFETKIGGELYAYSFEIDNKQIHHESLYQIRPASEKLLFKRSTDKNGRTKVEFGNFPLSAEQHEQFLKYTVTGTRANQLFLTESVQRNVKYFADVYDWFQNRLVLLYPHSIPGAEIGIRYVNNEDGFQEKYRDLIQLYDLDIDDIAFRRVDVDPDQLFSEQDKLNINQLVSDLPDDPSATAVLYSPHRQLFVFIDKSNQYSIFQFVTVHQVKHEDRSVSFELFRESDGTIRLFELTPALIRLLSSNDEIVFVVDELDRSFHAQMTQNILDIFLSNSVGKPCQLIVTTHEAGLLNLDILRRDEIWFIEKDRYAASQVYSLEEFAPRNDMDIEKGYLHGRFGAIPILPSYNVVDWAK